MEKVVLYSSWVIYVYDSKKTELYRPPTGVGETGKMICVDLQVVHWTSITEEITRHDGIILDHRGEILVNEIFRIKVLSCPDVTCCESCESKQKRTNKNLPSFETSYRQISIPMLE